MSNHDTLTSLFSASASGFRYWTDDELRASRQAALQNWQPGNDIWVFGYGSLIWRPEFAHEERRDALLRGYHRSLCLWSRINRGTPERPGLVFGLDTGGACRGVAYRVSAEAVPQTLEALWQREMPSGAYLPKWLSCRTATGTIQALVFVMDRSKPAYARNLSTEQQVQVVRHAHGKYGPCVEYVLETVHALRQAGIHDHRLETLFKALHHTPDRLAEYT